MNDAEYRALQEQAHLMDELTRHPGWTELVGLMHALMVAPKKELLNGDASSMEEYQNIVGYLSGIHRVLDWPGVVQQRLVTERERRIEHDEPLV